MNAQKINYDERYDRMVNNIIYENNPQNNCPICHFSICICNKKNPYKSEKSQIIYNSFNTENERRHQSFKINKNLINLNKIKRKPKQFPLLNDQIQFPLFTPSSTRASQKKLKNNFIFYHDNEVQTLYNNNSSIEKLGIDSYTNAQNEEFYKIRHLTNNKKVNNSVSGKIVIPYLSNINTFNSMNNHRNNNNQEIFNDNFITIKNNKNNIMEKSNNSIEKSINNKFIAKKTIKDESEINKTLEKPFYGSFANIHRNPVNKSIVMNNIESISPISKNEYSHKRHNFFKKSNSGHFDKNNNNNLQTNFNNINLNIKNNYSYQINSNNILNFPNNTIEQIKKYNSFKNDVKGDQIILKNIIRLKRKNNISKNKSNNKGKIPSDECFYDKKIKENRNTDFERKSPINIIYENNIIYSKIRNNNYFTNNKTDWLDDNKENQSNNFIKDNLLREKKTKAKINSKLFEKFKNNISKNCNNKSTKFPFFQIPNNRKPNSSNNNDIHFSKSRIDRNNNELIDINPRSEVESNNKLKNVELISLLKKANSKILQLKLQLNNNKKVNNNKIITNNYKKMKINKVNNEKSKVNIKPNFQNKNFLNIKIGEENPRKTYKNLKTNFNQKLLIKESILFNSQIFNSQNNRSSFNTSDYKIIFNENFSITSNIKLNKFQNKQKVIFSIYNSKNKKFKNSLLCFDVETKIFEIKNIDTKNSFHKNFYDSINKKNKINKSIYLVNDNNYYIVTGLNCTKFYKYSYELDIMKQFSDLKYNHSNGQMIPYFDKIICLSGNSTKKVELFLEDENVWKELPEMQIERSYFSACIIKNRYLFSFFGYNFPNRNYLYSIEYLDLFIYNKIASLKIGNNKNENIFWRYLDYNYFNNNSPFQKINLIGSIAVNYNNEKILFLGGQNYLSNDEDDGYYQLILDDTKINSELYSYFEKIKTKNFNNLSKNYFFNNFKCIEDLENDNILKEPVFAAFDNKFNAHLIKLSTMNHEIYNINL